MASVRLLAEEVGWKPPLVSGEIDEFDIHVIPTLIGDGIPLVAPCHRDVPLRLRSARKYPDGVVRRRYEVVKHLPADAPN